jgi:hypothetical protein
MSFPPVLLRIVYWQTFEAVLNKNCLLKTARVSLGFILIGLFAGNVAKAVSNVSLQWAPNTDPSVVGYNVYYGGSSRSYTNSIPAGNVTNTVVDGLVEGKTYYFAVTAYDLFGDESDYSEETVYIVPGFLTLNLGQNIGDPMQIRFSVAPAHWYELQVSGDLENWVTIWHVQGVSNSWLEFDAPINAATSQYFRVIIR